MRFAFLKYWTVQDCAVLLVLLVLLVLVELEQFELVQAELVQGVVQACWVVEQTMVAALVEAARDKYNFFLMYKFF